MGEKIPDDVARALLFTTTDEREAHATAVEAMRARNESLRTNDGLIAEELATNAGFRDEWQRTALGRAVATALVRYRADCDLSQRELADRLGMTLFEVERLEMGEVNPRSQTLIRVFRQLGIELPLDTEPPPRT